MKDLDTVEPRTPLFPPAARAAGPGRVLLISAPGSYYLTGNLAVPTGMSGIEIAASNVTLDLDGFAITGVAGSLSGILVTGARQNIAIHNGSLATFDQHGVNASTASSSQLRDLHVYDYGVAGAFDGLRIGDGGIVTRCSVQKVNEVGGNGIVCTRNCVISQCNALTPGDTGIRLTSDGGRINNCTVYGVRAGGIVAAADSVIENNSVDLIFDTSAEGGIDVGSRCRVIGNNCNSTIVAGNGIRATGSGNHIEGNTVVYGGTAPTGGIVVTGAGNVIVKNFVKETPAGPAVAYSIAAGNRYGPIIDITAGGTAAVSGNSAVSTVSSTDPWANFAY